jgi:flagellar basal body rod protein FlgG
MRMSQDYQELVSENLSLQSIPGFKQSLPVFSTDLAAAGSTTQTSPSGNPAAVSMNRVIDFSQGELQNSGDPYHVAIEGKAFFKIREADGSTTYSRNGAFSLTQKGELTTSDGATVLGKGGSAVHIDTSKGSIVTIGKDGSISVNGTAQGSLGLAHFDSPSASLQQGPYGRFVAAKSSDAKDGLDKNDLVLQGSLEEGNANPVTQMADMVQAVRLYEVNSKSVQAIDDNQNQLITSLGGHPQA